MKSLTTQNWRVNNNTQATNQNFFIIRRFWRKLGRFLSKILKPMELRKYEEHVLAEE